MHTRNVLLCLAVVLLSSGAVRAADAPPKVPTLAADANAAPNGSSAPAVYLKPDEAGTTDNTSAMAGGALVIVRPIVLQTPSGLNTVPPGVLPNSAGIVDIGNIFVIELWAQQTVPGPVPNGISCAFSDLTFDPATTTCSSVSLAPGFLDFSGNGGGACDNVNGLVDEVGGCNFTSGLGISPGWVRIATIFETADAATSGNVIGSGPATTTISLVSFGNVPPAQIQFEATPPFCIRTSLIDDSCNGIDDDCDGVIDDDYAPDATCGVGLCQTNNTPSTCVAGIEAACQPGTPEATDIICDGVDNDCNAVADDGYVSDATCGVGACLTGNTPSTCVGGLETFCQAGTPAASDTTCDAIDDDCNGTADDGYVSDAACGVGLCQATNTPSTCAGGVETACQPGTPEATDIICDGVDNDCNGTPDDGYVTDAACGVGLCQTANAPSTCVGGIETACQPGTPEAADIICDGVDNDCNGTADDGYVSDSTCGVGACLTGNTPSTCVAGVETLCQAGTPAASDTTCDTIDDDCNGTADDGYVTDASCGVGACLTGNTPSTCVAGVETLCQAGTPAASDTTCDTIDDDCNGTADDGYVTDASCGVGACLTGNTPSTCVAGVETLCQAGTPAASDTTCNAIDDDCNGTADDGYVTDASCGVGACLTSNTPSTCVAGAETLCQPGTPAAGDATCDAIDDDCNGSADDGYVSDSTCGVGACLTGNTPSTCVGGVEALCQAGTPAASDTTCDAIDDDCNGIDDDGYVTDATCGVGACLTGNAPSTCVGGVETLCQAGTPAVDDVTCDNVDDDCDGFIDNGYVAPATTCGVGTCGSTGLLECLAGGVPNDTCTPGLPTAEVCDGADNDCNGTIDDEPAASTSCDDALFCTGPEACVSGFCQSAPVCFDSCESCNETADACDWCVFDHNQNGVTDGLDFAFFSGCFGLCYNATDACAAANYDGDPNHCVGGGDFGAFSGCFTLSCGSCPLCFPGSGGRGGVAGTDGLSATVELVAVNSATASDFAATLPTGDAENRADDFFLEVWANRSGAETGKNGLASVYVDVQFEPGTLWVTEILASEAFAMLSGGAIDPVGGMVRDLGGCAPLGDGSMGIDSTWVRVATLHVQARSIGLTRINLIPAAPPFGVSLFGRLGDLGVADVQLGRIVLDLKDSSVPAADLKSRRPARSGR